MVVGRVLRATGCPNCRISIVRSFASLPGPSIRTLHPSARLQYPISCARARFSSNVVREDHIEDRVNGTPDHNIRAEEIGSVEESPQKTEESGAISAVPWYLQVDSPQRVVPPLSEGQRVPDLPESPPPILQPLLEQLSVDLGLDNLSLLDLRKLDPPPALGANLMMVIGTARSEKHLHVSADRFCRWLRSTYHLRPDADGLLGRNELKLKLRRKARRAKLLGSITEDNEDDGVRTGWVCVDAGVVEGPDPVTENEPDMEKFIGFGRRTDGVRMVVQMLTEDKREEIDLERLWGGILKRGIQQQINESGEVDSGKPAGLDAPSSTLSTGSNVLSSIPSQSRGFHTSVLRLSTRPEARHNTQPDMSALSDSAGTDVPPIGAKSSGLSDVRLYLKQCFASGEFGLTETSFLPFIKDAPRLQNGWRTFLFEQMQEYLESIPKDDAIRLLGSGPTDRTSTPFVANFHRTVPAFHSEADGKVIIDHHCYAMEIGHEGYDLTGLLNLVTMLQVKGIPISTESYLRMLRNALESRSSSHPTATPTWSIESAMKIFRVMHDQGHKVLTEQVFLVLQEALAPEMHLTAPKPYTSPLGTFYLPSQVMSHRQQRVHAAMMAVDMPFFQDETRLRLLDLYSQKQYWHEFFQVWRMAPRSGQRQSPRMYAFMFRKVAETNNQKACIQVLRTWVPEMDLETPKVLLEGDVADAVRALLRVADPYAEGEVDIDPAATGEWIDLWRRTLQGRS
jgi:hypothetical protein